MQYLPYAIIAVALVAIGYALYEYYRETKKFYKADERGDKESQTKKPQL